LKQTYTLSSNFIGEIIKLAGGYLSPEEMDNFFNVLESESGKYHFTMAAENNLLRVIQSFFDRTSLIKDAGRYPVYIEILLAASVNSNYICDILVRDPEYFYWIANPSHLLTKLSREEYSKTVSELTGRYRTFTSRLNALKSFKRKEILRTGMQDLLGVYSLPEITLQLSLLASVILDELFRLCYDEISSKYKVNFRSSYCLIALGKLGGRELNYSSDTDLMIFYDRERKHGKKYYQEYLTEAVKLFIDSSSRMTDNGYLYRIDFRLRPDGKNSPLCGSIQEYFAYYEARGESWERQMLIKSDYVSGDKDLYKSFIEYLTPYIYPSVQSGSPAEEVLKIKNSIEKNLKNDLNIKLTKGGIRDIEFSVQVLQLLNGGNKSNLRQQNTLKAIDELAKSSLISEEERQTLTYSYILFRKTEHYLQLMNDRQVHTIPEAGEVVDKMASFLGFNSRMSFIEHLNETRDRVRNIYLSFIPAEAEVGLGRSIYKNRQQAERDLDYLREGKSLSGEKTFDRKTQKKFLELEPLLNKYLSRFPDPDLLLRNFTFFIQSSGIPSIWYSEFLDEKFLDYFLRIAAYSKKGIVLLSTVPGLDDFLLSRRVFMEYSIKELISFPVRKVIFYFSVKLALQQITPEGFSELLSSYCIAIVKRIAESKLGRRNYFVAAMGSLGSGEMSYSSDMDLIFITKGDSGKNDESFRKILLEINKELIYFKADCRLRPEGEGSQLSWDLDAYVNYIGTRGRIWELQALCKLKFISGDKKMFENFEASAAERIKNEECQVIKKAVLSMREKIYDSGISSFSRQFHLKKDRGGITDIEFIVQYLILCNVDLYKKCRGKSLPGMTDIIISSSDEFADLEKIKEGYLFLHGIIIVLQSAFDTDKVAYPADEPGRRIIASFYGYSVEELDRRFSQVIKDNYSLFEKYLK
jgi:[glutamine synthetase] adenylyltransferase / [glutamine synthetase]-adenylyl-L-tyrosine phosphorylase